MKCDFKKHNEFLTFFRECLWLYRHSCLNVFIQFKTFKFYGYFDFGKSQKSPGANLNNKQLDTQ